ncbi:hypothetical protein [Legionella drancourtii]|nr:hypothetical protein [Legionella drancourtii]
MFTKSQRPRSDTYIVLSRDDKKKAQVSVPSSPGLKPPASPLPFMPIKSEQEEFIKDTGIPLPETETREFLSRRGQYRYLLAKAQQNDKEDSQEEIKESSVAKSCFVLY